MNFKKYVLGFFALILIGVQSAFALEVTDVTTDYWAGREIVNSIQNGYLQLNEKNQFLPESTISRADFVGGLIKALESDNIQVLAENELQDLTPETKNVQSILIAEQLRIIFGYPDKTFKADKATSRAEASSALGRITIGEYNNTAILDRFEDRAKIPNWAILPCAKAVKNGLYVNYPNANLLRPNDNLTRAEAAVLFDKVSNSLELIDAKYKADLITQIPDILLSTETLKIHPQPLTNVVEIYNRKKVIKAGNIIKGTFMTPINYKKAKVGDIIEFTAPEDVVTEQGTFLYSKGTKFSAEVLRIKPSIWRGKNDKTLLVLDRIMLTDGYHFAMAGVPLTKDRKILWIFKKSKVVYTSDKHPEWMPKKKGKKFSEADFLVNYGYKVSPRVKFKNSVGQEIYILLTDDLILLNREEM